MTSARDTRPNPLTREALARTESASTLPSLRYAGKGPLVPSTRTSTGARKGAVSAVIKVDSDDIPTAVYNEYAAVRIGELVGIPLACGVLTPVGEAIGFASLVAAMPGGRLPYIVARRQSKLAALRYPSEAAALFVFDVLVGNWDRIGNARASIGRGRAPVFFGFDHANSLLMAAGKSREESIRALGEGETVLHQHLFGGLLSDRLVELWVERFQALPQDMLERRCLIGYRLNDVTESTQRALARAIHRRVGRLHALCDTVRSLCGGPG